jgi:hypothetical protein
VDFGEVVQESVEVAVDAFGAIDDVVEHPQKVVLELYPLHKLKEVEDRPECIDNDGFRSEVAAILADLLEDVEYFEHERVGLDERLVVSRLVLADEPGD